MTSATLALLATLLAAPQSGKRPWYDADSQFEKVGVFTGARSSSSVNSWAVKEDGTLIMWGGPRGGESIIEWSSETGELTRMKPCPRPEDRGTSVFMGPTGKYLFWRKKLPAPVVSGEEVTYVDTSTGRKKRTVKLYRDGTPFKVTGSSDDERYLAFEVAGKCLSRGIPWDFNYENRETRRDFMLDSFLLDRKFALGHDMRRTSFLLMDIDKKKSSKFPYKLIEDQRIRRVTGSPDGRYLVLLTQDREIRLIDVKRKKQIMKLESGDDATAAFDQAWISPKGDRVVTASASRIARIWDPKKRKPEPLAEHSNFYAGGGSLYWTKDGKYMIAVYGYGMKVFDAKSGEFVRSVRTVLDERAALSGDGQFALDIEGSGVDGENVFFWKLNPPALLWQQKMPGDPNFARLTFDGSHAAISVGQLVHLLDLKTQKVVATIEGRECVGALPGGKGIVKVHDHDRKLGAYGVGGGDPIWEKYDDATRFRAVSVNPEGTYVVAFTDKPVVLTGSEGTVTSADTFDLGSLAKYVPSRLAVSADGKVVAALNSAGQAIVFWSSDGKKLGEHFFPTETKIEKHATLSLSADGKRALIVQRHTLIQATVDKGIGKVTEMKVGDSSYDGKLTGNVLLYDASSTVVVRIGEK